MAGVRWDIHMIIVDTAGETRTHIRCVHAEHYRMPLVRWRRQTWITWQMRRRLRWSLPLLRNWRRNSEVVLIPSWIPVLAERGLFYRQISTFHNSLDCCVCFTRYNHLCALWRLQGGNVLMAKTLLPVSQGWPVNCWGSSRLISELLRVGEPRYGYQELQK